MAHRVAGHVTELSGRPPATCTWWCTTCAIPIRHGAPGAAIPSPCPMPCSARADDADARRQLSVKVPAGSQPASVLRLREACRFGGGRRGDLYLRLDVEVPKKLSAKERRLTRASSGPAKASGSTRKLAIRSTDTDAEVSGDVSARSPPRAGRQRLL